MATYVKVLDNLKLGTASSGLVTVAQSTQNARQWWDRWLRRTFCPWSYLTQNFTATTVPASPHSPAVSFTADMLCVTFWSSVPQHEEQRFYFLNTQNHHHIRVADGLVWITSINSFPQTSIHWMFQHFGWFGIFFFFLHISRITSCLQYTALQLLTNPDKSLGVSVLPQMEKWQVLPMRSSEIIFNF